MEKSAPGRSLGLLAALAFNICLLALPISGAWSLLLIQRDGLYTYAQSEGVNRDVKRRVEQLAGDLILLDFDRRRQWDDLVALELAEGDAIAARGFLLSARYMISPADSEQFWRTLPPRADDAVIESAALELLQPSTRARYESIALRREPAPANEEPIIGNARDFELLSAAMLDEADADQMQFTLVGLGLGLAGDLTPRAQAGAATLLESSQRSDFPLDLRDDTNALLASVAPLEAFRTASAAASAEGKQATSYAVASETFRSIANPARMAPLTDFLEEIGAMREAAGQAGAAQLLVHGESVRDAPRLRQIAVAAGERAQAVAKRMERNGRLVRAAHGSLRFTRELLISVIIAGVALAGIVVLTGAEARRGVTGAVQGVRRRFAKQKAENDLVHSFDRFRTL